MSRIQSPREAAAAFTRRRCATAIAGSACHRRVPRRGEPISHQELHREFVAERGLGVEVSHGGCQEVIDTAMLRDRDAVGVGLRSDVDPGRPR